MLGKQGFTLIELMVSIAIISIMAVVAIVNFGQNADQDVRMEKDRLTSFLREVQSKAVTGEKQNSSVVPDGERVCGFGVKQNGSNLESFLIKTSDANEICSVDWASHLNTSDEKKLDTFFPGTGIALSLPGDLFFLSPSGIPLCANGCVLGTPLVTIAKSGASASISVSPSGRIY
jgi:prepilin-type N-terminal cleavage/methylation domain-containing protein